MKDGRGICFELTHIAILFTILTTTGIVYSLQGMFYPHEAESKGANPFEYGLIFATYELVVLIASPIIGSNIQFLPLKTTILFGMLLCGSSTILFGLTDKLEGTWVFLLSCSVLRVCEAIGASSILMGSIVFIATEFPRSIAKYTGIWDTAFMIGSGIGPSAAAPLFQLGGFELPFMCVGGFLLVLILLPLLLISKNEKSAEPGQGFGFIRLLQTPPVLLYAINSVILGVGVTFLLSMLEPHVRKFELTENELGLLFLTMNGVCALTISLFGWMADRMSHPGFLALLGICLMAIAVLLIGPATFIPIKQTIGWTVGGLVLVGLGQGATSVSGYIEMIHESERAGFTDVLSRSGLISGLYVSSYRLGGFIGPTLGGLFVTHFGFPYASDFLFVLYSLLAVTLGLFLRHRVTQHVPLK